MGDPVNLTPLERRALGSAAYATGAGSARSVRDCGWWATARIEGGIMRHSSLRLPSPAMVVALVALLVALSSTGYAAFNATVPDHSVGTKQLKDGAVTTIKIKTGAVTARKINPAGLTVPNATNAIRSRVAGQARTATQAAEAEAVGHNTVQMVDVSLAAPASGQTSRQLFKLAGLTLTHSCASAGGGNQDLTASASQAGDLKIVTTNEHESGANQVAQELSDFGPANGTTDLYGGISDTQNVVGRLIWTTESGQVLTFDFQDDSSAFSGGGHCTLAGMAEASVQAPQPVGGG